ncbi:hypothetical protein ACRAWF_36080 [Streptomyces sp. L7]
MRQIGSVIGAAAVGALLQGRLAAELATGKTRTPPPSPPLLHTTALMLLAALAVGAVACLSALRSRAAQPRTAGVSAPAGAGPDGRRPLNRTDGAGGAAPGRLLPRMAGAGVPEGRRHRPVRVPRGRKRGYGVTPGPGPSWPRRPRSKPAMLAPAA